LQAVSETHRAAYKYQKGREIMTRRKIHFRHPNGASDEAWCSGLEDCLTTNRPHEVECVRCRACLEEDGQRYKEFYKLQKDTWANHFKSVFNQYLKRGIK